MKIERTSHGQYTVAISDPRLKLGPPTTKEQLVERVRAIVADPPSLTDREILDAMNLAAKEYRVFRETEAFADYVVREAVAMLSRGTDV